MPSPLSAAPPPAILLVDFQRDFLEPAGRMPIAQPQVPALLDAANRLADAAHACGAPVAYVGNEFPASQWVLNFFRRRASMCGSPGAALDPRVHVVTRDYFPKDRSDAFSNPALDAYLRAKGTKRLVVAGVFAPHCIRATVNGAIDRGYDVLVPREAVGAASDRARDRALDAMRSRGARVVDTREALALLDPAA